MTKNIRPYATDGAWVSSHRFYYESAYKFKDEYNKLLATLSEEEEKIRKENYDIGQENIESFVCYKTDRLREEAYRYATSSILFACMTVEGLINYYGAVRLGSEFYKRNLERVGITEKLSLILLMCLEVKLKKNDELLNWTRKLFDKRNSLVHPKTKEFYSKRMKDFVTLHPSEISVEETIEDIEFIIENLKTLDADIGLKMKNLTT
ncbi:MAG: hypothetical protein AB7D06_08535 [Pedobacter sp.]